ncbi:MAG: hypothetical protein ABI210_08895 [Abditibacteriaceae bacterium]
MRYLKLIFFQATNASVLISAGDRFSTSVPHIVLLSKVLFPKVVHHMDNFIQLN